MPTGYFALVLHAHLPFVRHPDDPTVMEEQWLYEAITGTYLPLLQMFEGLQSDKVPYRCTVSLSAPLIAMLTDDLLKVRYADHLDDLILLAEKEPTSHCHNLPAADDHHSRPRISVYKQTHVLTHPSTQRSAEQCHLTLKNTWQCLQANS